MENPSLNKLSLLETEEKATEIVVEMDQVTEYAHPNS